MKPLRYFFLRSYQLNINQRSAVPWLRPLALLSALIGVNVLVVVTVCAEFAGKGAIIVRREYALEGIVILWTIAVFGALYNRWIRNGRYLAFKDEFKSESNALRKVRTLWMFAYGIASLCGPAIVGYWGFLRDA